jgi:hypothetical protein
MGGGNCSLQSQGALYFLLFYNCLYLWSCQRQKEEENEGEEEEDDDDDEDDEDDNDEEDIRGKDVKKTGASKISTKLGNGPSQIGTQHQHCLAWFHEVLNCTLKILKA